MTAALPEVRHEEKFTDDKDLKPRKLSRGSIL